MEAAVGAFPHLIRSQSNHCGMEIAINGRSRQSSIIRPVSIEPLWNGNLTAVPFPARTSQMSQSNHCGMEIKSKPSHPTGQAQVSIEPLWNGNVFPLGWWKHLNDGVSIEPLWNGNYSREQKPEARSPGSIELKWIAIQKARKD